MSEEFNLGDLELDEGTQARIAHAEFLEKVKDWGMTLGLIMVPFAHMAQAIMAIEEDDDKDEKEKRKLYARVSLALPEGISILVDQINELYVLMQEEAVKVLGAPFAMHDQHHPNCDGNRENCGHQDHFTGESK
jgi:hypothetical protein